MLDSNENRSKKTLDLLDQFAKYSGLKPNIDKTCCIWIGSERNKTNILCQENNLNWTKDSFTFLGVIFSVNIEEIVHLNFVDKLNEVRKLVYSWSRRKITTLGKITVVKNIILPRLTYLFLSLPKPCDGEIKQLELLFFNYIWHGKKDRVARKTIIQNYDQGGLKMVHIESFIKNLKLSWLQRLRSSNSSWTKLFYHITTLEVDFLNFGKDYFCEKANISNKFWKEVLLSMADFIACVKVNSENISQEPIWYNTNIKVSKKNCIL